VLGLSKQARIGLNKRTGNFTNLVFMLPITSFRCLSLVDPTMLVISSPAMMREAAGEGA